MSSEIEGAPFAENHEGVAPSDPASALLTGAIPVVPTGIAYQDPAAEVPQLAPYAEALLTGAIPVVAEAAPVTAAIPIVAPATGAIPAVLAEPELFTGAIPVLAEPAALTGAIPVMLPDEAVEAEPPTLEQWQVPPYLRWSMHHIKDFLPVRMIDPAPRPREIERRRAELETLTVSHPWEDRVASFADVMQQSFTDGWLVMHRGTVVAERYFDELTESGAHLLMSVSKSLTATVAGIVADAGELDLDKPVTDYVPELKDSGYDGATVRQLVDMRTGVKFSEEYLNNDAEVRLLEEAIGWAPKRHPEVPDSLLGFLATLQKKTEHGEAFDYKSCETDALGFVIERAAGEHTADVMSKRLWHPMSAEFAANVGVDSVGAGMFDGGVSATLRDLAKFGHLFVNQGRAADGTQVLTEEWVNDTFAGGEDSREAFAKSPEPTLMPGGMYRNGFWFPGESGDVMLALGIHGQMIYMNRVTGVVGVKLSSWPTPQDAEKLFWTLRSFEAASWALSSGAA